MDQTPAQIAEREGWIDKLQAAADGAAGEVRNLYIAFLSFGLYLAITVGATTDEQLLRESPVRLPIVDVGLPLVAFYWIAPLLFVMFHFNLLMQLYLLSEKLHRLDAAIRRRPDDAQRERRATLSQFMFSQMLVGAHGSRLIRVLLNVIAWITFVVLPIAVLLLVQIQFLPYHDLFTTWWHRLLIALDLLLLWLLWLPAIEPTGHLSRQLRLVARRRSRRALRGLANPLKWPAWAGIGLRSLIRGVATLPARIRRRVRGDPKRDWRLLRLQELSAVSLLIALLVAAIPGTFLAAPIDGLIGERGNLGVLNRNLSLREAELMAERPPPGLIESIGEEQAFEKYARGLDLRGRDLRFADLELAVLRKVDFRRTDLQGADLEEADLQGAFLTRADLRGTDLEQADLRGTDLRWADLQGAFLARANLQGADLAEADLQGADLAEADLRGAYLSCPRRSDCTNLQGAVLGGANLQGAGLGGAALQGADLAEADLRGADLRGAQLWRASIGDRPGRDHLWNLVDLRGARIDPVDVDALVTEMQDRIADEQRRAQVTKQLEAALRDDRPDLPSWQGQPNVIFHGSDPVPRALAWAAPRMTEAAYDEKLATFLGNLACGDHGSPAQGLARRAVNGARPEFGEPDRLLYQRLARRLTSDDPEACSAAGLAEHWRSRLEELAARLDPPPAGQAEPAPAPPDSPLQGPGTPSRALDAPPQAPGAAEHAE
jgi:uncharacterized protein YjbI with pentapeptide repeats